MKKVDYPTVQILKDKHCNYCGWPIVFVCCNGSFTTFSDPKDGPWDWWYYCSNKACKHHEGEGIFQDIPEWVSKD